MNNKCLRSGVFFFFRIRKEKELYEIERGLLFWFG